MKEKDVSSEEAPKNSNPCSEMAGFTIELPRKFLHVFF
jgi:hypothetical protein